VSLVQDHIQEQRENASIVLHKRKQNSTLWGSLSNIYGVPYAPYVGLVLVGMVAHMRRAHA